MSRSQERITFNRFLISNPSSLEFHVRFNQHYIYINFSSIHRSKAILSLPSGACLVIHHIPIDGSIGSNFSPRRENVGCPLPTIIKRTFAIVCDSFIRNIRFHFRISSSFLSME